MRGFYRTSISYLDMRFRAVRLARSVGSEADRC